MEIYKILNNKYMTVQQRLACARVKNMTSKINQLYSLFVIQLNECCNAILSIIWWNYFWKLNSNETVWFECVIHVALQSWHSCLNDINHAAIWINQMHVTENLWNMCVLTHISVSSAKLKPIKLTKQLNAKYLHNETDYKHKIFEVQ